VTLTVLGFAILGNLSTNKKVVTLGQRRGVQQDCNSNDWDVHDSLSITARYLRLTFTATNNLQVREAVVNGTVNTGSGGGGGGGPVISGGGVVIHAPKGAGMISN
jgi:hypothetical protein